MLPANVVIVFINETRSLLVISFYAASWRQPSDTSQAFIIIAITQFAGRQAENDERIPHDRSGMAQVLRTNWYAFHEARIHGIQASFCRFRNLPE